MSKKKKRSSKTIKAESLSSEINKNTFANRAKYSNRNIKSEAEYKSHPSAQFLMTFIEFKKTKVREEIFKNNGYNKDGLTK